MFNNVRAPQSASSSNWLRGGERYIQHRVIEWGETRKGNVLGRPRAGGAGMLSQEAKNGRVALVEQSLTRSIQATVSAWVPNDT